MGGREKAVPLPSSELPETALMVARALYGSGSSESPLQGGCRLDLRWPSLHHSSLWHSRDSGSLLWQSLMVSACPVGPFSQCHCHHFLILNSPCLVPSREASLYQNGPGDAPSEQSGLIEESRMVGSGGMGSVHGGGARELAGEKPEAGPTPRKGGTLRKTPGERIFPDFGFIG